MNLLRNVYRIITNTVNAPRARSLLPFTIYLDDRIIDHIDIP